MAKGDESKEMIIEASVGVFNTKGYAGTSMQDIMDKTGFTKGGIYRHFESKEDLAAQAFSKAYQQMKEAYKGTFDREDKADVKLIKFLSRMKTFMLQPPVKGGCPILNSATEVDDTNEALRKVVRQAADDWERIMINIFEQGRTEGTFADNINSVTEARMLIASIEGALMLCKLHRDIEYGLCTADVLMQRVAAIKK